ncbi:MAG: TIGR03790 family protein [Terriglobia bacterium]
MAGKMGAMRLTVAFLGCITCVSAFAQGPENILLVVNKDSKLSKAVAQYYLRRRNVPSSQVCFISTLDQDEIDRVSFEDEIRKPILNCLRKGALQDRVLYIVLTKGVPLKIKPAEKNDQASVDSELAMAYPDLLGIPRQLVGGSPNPYFAANSRGKFLRFSHRDFPIYLVTRLDGYSLDDIRALIDRGLVPSRDGRFVLDLSGDDNAMGNDWLRQAAAKLQAAGIPESRIRLETTQAFHTGERDVLGYAGWGSNDRSNHSRGMNNTWVNGALMVEFVSTDARTFEPPPKNWTIGKWSDPPNSFFAGSPQSLIGDYIHEGVTGVAGNVYEPYLRACARPQILFPAYLSGLNLAESFYAALPFLSWQTVVIGDPLTSPFPGTPLPHDELEPPKDPSSGLPKYFAAFAARTKKLK